MSATITFFGHATFRLILPDERVVWMDPWLRDNPACPDNLKKVNRCDMILLTHGHGDHTGDVERLVKQFDPLVIANFELCNLLEQQIGQGRYSGMNPGGTQTVEGVSVSLTKAFHSSSYPTPGGMIYAGMPNGLVVSFEDLAPIYHAGDTDVFSDMKLIAQIFEPKVCILPIGDHFTMGAKGAAIAAEFLNPTTIIPCHYKTFPVLDQTTEKFESELSPELKSRLLITEIGKPYNWTDDGLSE